MTRDRDRSRHNAEAQRQYDRVRDQWLQSQGFQILRYWNNEVFDEWEEADLGRDALNGSTKLLGADMAGASIVRAKLDGAE